MAEKINPANEIQRSQLAVAQQRFVRTWKPEEIHRVEEFERELFSLLYLAQQVAVAPILANLAVFPAPHYSSSLRPNVSPLT